MAAALGVLLVAGVTGRCCVLACCFAHMHTGPAVAQRVAMLVRQHAALCYGAVLNPPFPPLLCAEMTATGDDTSLETWNESAMAAFAAASLDLLQQSEGLDVKEKALFAMCTLLGRRGPAGGAALANEGAEAVLREVLIELDLLADKYKEQAEAAAKSEAAAAEAAAKSEAAAKQSQEGDLGEGGSTPEGDEGAGDEGEGSESEQAAGHYQYAQYVGHLCADVLHHLAVHHDEL